MCFHVKFDPQICFYLSAPFRCWINGINTDTTVTKGMLLNAAKIVSANLGKIGPLIAFHNSDKFVRNLHLAGDILFIIYLYCINCSTCTHLALIQLKIIDRILYPIILMIYISLILFTVHIQLHSF